MLAFYLINYASTVWSPWYKRTGWLGVKHQLTYLLLCGIVAVKSVYNFFFFFYKISSSLHSKTFFSFFSFFSVCSLFLWLLIRHMYFISFVCRYCWLPYMYYFPTWTCYFRFFFSLRKCWKMLQSAESLCTPENIAIQTLLLLILLLLSILTDDRLKTL